LVEYIKITAFDTNDFTWQNTRFYLAKKSWNNNLFL